MTYEQWVAVEKAYDDLIKCFLSAENFKAVAVVHIHKALAEIEWGKQTEKEQTYYNSGKPLEIQ
jgi:hypothetical protein